MHGYDGIVGSRGCAAHACAERAGLHEAVLGLAHYCLSGDVAVPLRQTGARRLHIAPRPDETALFDLIRT